MTFASIEKLIRKETRRVIENLERSFSLYQEDENSDKILVVNKESGKSYYINKDSFDPSKHQTSKPKETTKEEEEPAPAEEPAPTEEPKEEPAPAEEPKEEEPAETLPGFESPAPEEKPADDKGEADAKPEGSGNESKTGLKSVGTLNKVDTEKLSKRTDNLYPETREHLLQYDYEDIIDMYDLRVGDKKVNFNKLYKRVEMIAVSKHSLIQPKKIEKETVMALTHYYTNSEKINNIVRFSGPKVGKQEIQKQMKLGKPKEGDKREKDFNSAMNAFTIYEMDYAFSEQLHTLNYNILTYRSVKNDDVLQMFVDAGQWVDKSFVTTSLNPLIIEDGTKKRLPLFEFFIPAGTSILTLPCKMNDYCHETEITLPRNCRYTIQGFNSDRNIYKILVEQKHGG